MHPGMTHYPQANTPVRVPDIVNAMRDPGFLPKAWGQQLGAGNALYDAYQSQNALQKMGVLPGIGDVAGFAGDMQMMYQNPEERTVPNALLAGAGLVPFVPAGLGTVKKVLPEKKIAQLADKYGEVDFPQRNYQGGQQVNLITPSGKFIQSNESSHNNMLKRVGIEESIEDFMGETGVIRMHDTDNYEIWGKPTREQMKSIFDASGGDAYIDIMNPQTGESLFSDLVSMESYTDLQRVINQSFILERNGEQINALAPAGLGTVKRSLPMDEASRMQRAREMGFDTEDIQLHASNEVFAGSRGAAEAKEAGIPIREEFRKEYGGTYLSGDYDAEAIFTGSNPYAMESGEYFIEKGNFLDLTGSIGPKEKKALDKAVNNAIDEKDLAEIRIKLEEPNWTPAEAIREGSLYFDTDRKTQNKIMENLFSEGYETVRFNDWLSYGSPHVSTVVKEPKSIRSKFATFDHAKRESTNILAGAAGAGLGLHLLSNRNDE